MPAGIAVCQIANMELCCAERNMAYWLRIMMEHAIFIANGIPIEREDLRAQAEQFRAAFAELLRINAQLPTMGPAEVMAFMRTVRAAVANFLAYKRMLIELALSCRVGGLGGYNYPLLLDHIAREAQLFLHIIDTPAVVSDDPYVLALGEEVFWLRIMTDHSKFIVSLLDQSERGFIEQAEEFAEVFDRLLRQAQDYLSMLQSDPSLFPMVSRFTSDIVAETVRIRDFKRAAHDLLLQCKILSILPPLLADHVAREAEHFLEVLAEIQSSLPA